MSRDTGAAYGYIWLNRVFVKRGSSFRLWKTSDIRLSQFEVLVILVLLLVLMGITVPIIALIMSWSAFANVINLWPLLLGNILAAWFFGRRLAKASPYSRFTGENIFDWFVVASDKRDTVLGRIFGHRVAVVEVTSWVNGKPQKVEAVEWIGSARAPDAPPRTGDMSETDTVPLYLVPRSEPTPWVAQTRARRARGARAEQLSPSGPMQEFPDPDMYVSSSAPAPSDPLPSRGEPEMIAAPSDDVSTAESVEPELPPVRERETVKSIDMGF